jgi:hypothetical protein
MNARRLVFTLALALAVVSALAAAARSQTNENQTSFPNVPDAQKEMIRLFNGVPPSVPHASPVVRDREGNIDRRSPKERYLNPDHPGVQPRPAPSEWWRYVDVPSEGLVPQARPDAEAALGIKFQSLPDVTFPDTVTVTYVRTPDGIFPEADPFRHPPGTNMLPTVFRNARDGLNNEMANTLPSTKTNPYNLHDGDPIVTAINPRSPTDDLESVINKVFEILTGYSVRKLWENLDAETLECIVTKKETQELHKRKIRENADLLRFYLQVGINIIEGKPISDRAYSELPLLHHSGHLRITPVIPVLDGDGRVISGNANVHQVWYDGRIESDTMFLDFSKMPPIDKSVPWTITYTIDVLERGRDDFATTTMFFDDPEAQKNFAQNQSGTPADRDVLKRQMQYQYKLHPGPSPPPGAAAAPGRAAAPPEKLSTLTTVSMDQTFFPMDAGTRTVLKIKMPPYKYFNLTYTWGWRLHPPRAQAMENAQKRIPPTDTPIVDFEKNVFTSTDPAFDPIFKLGDLDPAKRMWRAFHKTLDTVNNPPSSDRLALTCLAGVLDARDAFLDWKDRSHLPSGLRPDPRSDLTLLYVNNTIYGEFADGGWNDFPTWRTRGTPLKITLINGDYFDHGYINVDFGGNRGWESQFKSTLNVAGTGGIFSFGRFHYKFNTLPGTIKVGPAKPFMKDGKLVIDGTLPDHVEPAIHRLWIELNHDPGRRLRFYQFDPIHHDVAIFSVH